MQPRRSRPARPAVQRTSGDHRRCTSWHPAPAQPHAGQLAGIVRRRAHWRWTLVTLLYVFCMPHPAAFAGEEALTPEQMRTGSLLLRMAAGYEVATRLNTSIDARISGLVARVSVRQEFRNDGQDWVEGVYVFPLPDQAAVDHLRMYIGERFIEGEIREKAKARKEYEAAKSEGRKASLVEQQRANMFTTSVANIAPGESVTIEIEYLETLRYDDGLFSLRVPVTITPRYIPGMPLEPVDRKGSGWASDTTAVADASLITPPVVVTADDHKLSFTADLDPGVELEFVASRYHPVDIRKQGRRYQIGLVDGIVPMDHDVELTWKPQKDDKPRALMFNETVGGDAHLLGNEAAQGRYQGVGEHDHEGGGEPHGEGIDRRVGDGQHRAHAEHLHEHGVFSPQSLDEIVSGSDLLSRHRAPPVRTPSADPAPGAPTPDYLPSVFRRRPWRRWWPR